MPGLSSGLSLARCTSGRDASSSSSSSTPWRLSASVVVLAPYGSVPDCSLTDKTMRDGNFDYRVCCVRRASKSSFMPDAMVFPGGAVDAEDARTATALLGTDDLDATMRCAAIRETLEESGVALLDPTPQLHSEDYASWRQRIHGDPKELRTLCEELGVSLAANQLHYWCSFITPDAQHARLKRGGFDTWFYVCCTTADAVHRASADKEETVQLLWLTPSEALDAVRDGAITMVPPQWYILQELATSCPTLASVPAHVASEGRKLQREYPIKPYPVLLTEAETEALLARHGKDSSMKDQVFSMCYPGDEAHPVFPGPAGTRHRLLMIGTLGGRLFYELQRDAPALPLKEALRDWYHVAKL